MEVYVLIYEEPYESSEVLGVYFKLEDAKRVAEGGAYHGLQAESDWYEDKWGWGSSGYLIQKVEVI